METFCIRVAPRLTADEEEFVTHYLNTLAGVCDTENATNALSIDAVTDILQKSRVYHTIVSECCDFLARTQHLLDGKLEMAGTDFYLTRNSYGVGFWDGDWGEHGELLTQVAQSYSSSYLYRADDGEIYFTS